MGSSEQRQSDGVGDRSGIHWIRPADGCGCGTGCPRAFAFGEPASTRCVSALPYLGAIADSNPSLSATQERRPLGVRSVHEIVMG